MKVAHDWTANQATEQKEKSKMDILKRALTSANPMLPQLVPAWTPEQEKAYLDALRAKGFAEAGRLHPDVFASYKEAPPPVVIDGAGDWSSGVEKLREAWAKSRAKK